MTCGHAGAVGRGGRRGQEREGLRLDLLLARLGGRRHAVDHREVGALDPEVDHRELGRAVRRGEVVRDGQALLDLFGLQVDVEVAHDAGARAHVDPRCALAVGGDDVERPAPVVRVGGPAGLVVGEVPRPRAATRDQRLPAVEPGVAVGVVARQRVRVHVTGGRELVVPVERREELLGLVQVDQLSVVHPPLQRRAEGGVEVAVHVVERPHAVLGVGQLLAELHQVVGRLHLVGGDALGLEDVAAVVEGARDLEAGGEGRDAVQLLAPGAGPPRGGGDGREVGVLLDVVAGQVGRQVRELVAHQPADVHLGVPPGRQLDPVRQPLGGRHRRDDGVVVVAVRGLHLQLDAQSLVHRLVERVVGGRDGAPQRRDRRVLAALARHAGHRGDPVGRVAEEAGVRQHVGATRAPTGCPA